jgi:hypothetical protein
MKKPKEIVSRINNTVQDKSNQCNNKLRLPQTLIFNQTIAETQHHHEGQTGNSSVVKTLVVKTIMSV